MPSPSRLLTLCYVADASNIHVQRWLSYFVERGYRIYCLSDKAGAIDGVTVIDLPNRDSELAAGHKASKMAVVRARGRQIRKYLAELKPDVLHAIFLYQRGWSAALSNFTPWIVTLLGSDIHLPVKHYRSKWHLRRDKLLNALALKQASLVTAVSDELAQAANRMTMGMVPVALVPLGINPELFQPKEASDALRSELDISEEAFVVLSPRQITPHYNQTTILESVPLVLESIPHAIFIMKDTFCNTPERQAHVEKLKALASSLNINHAIRWASEVPMSKLPDYYNLADVIVSVPSTDGMPVTIFEAMACQKPIIVGDLPSYNEVVIHGQTGLRVPIRNSQALAQAIIKINSNPNLMHRMVEESQLILQQYGLFDTQMARMERYYQGLAQNQLETTQSLGKSLSAFFFKCVIQFT
jgi:glycosyltransferase involved in cell wall biosynthesis